ncbi:RICIN domain-containing protein [Microbacterium sp. VKM Ac-2923]|uniref:RICIN domain-containing protein n=1 Tax=Microbacterium sp. VKM Ac-2923 TaxID=2929476 RepID=UPI001FB4FAD8|nr:RICIN domain-containing protein [Microbacterium sp. VKM Ac-2923]MCJ1706062.1 RICIN domain-containing protein [Microbacterium sp. VKM Ac-2923]
MSAVVPRRAVGVLAAVTAALLAVALGSSAQAAERPAAVDALFDGVGAPSLMFVESVNAPGKALQVADTNAQVSSAPGATERAAAAIEAMKTGDATLLAAQALRFYPVTGAENTFVITDQQGHALVRSRNDQSSFRYLRLADVADVVTDPYAQWEARDAGNGSVNLVNVQRDPSQQEAALDLYNWKTADGSEVQTYTLSAAAAVQKWRMHPLTPTVAVPAAAVPVGQEPPMPAKLVARYGWGTSFPLTSVSWRTPDRSVWNAVGDVDVPGSAKGFFGETVAVTAHFFVGSSALVDDAAFTSYAGVTAKEVRMLAPRTVVRTVGGSGATVTTPVTWDFSGITDASFAQAGTITLPAAPGTGFEARLVITVVAPERVNHLRQSGVHPDYTFKDATAFALTDGNRNATGFADWRSGGATNRVNPNRVSFAFDQPRQISGVNVYDIGGKQNIGSVTVQYRTLLGGWKNLPTSSGWPVTNTSANLSLEASSTPVLATGVRVIIKNKSSNTWMSLSEIEAYGPRTPAS